MTKKQLRQRMEDMLIGANGGYSYDADAGPWCSMGPEQFCGWVAAVLHEFVPENHHLWELRSLHHFADFDKAVEAVWNAMPDEE